ncbi:MAG TPA: hypothetical protein VES66_03725 [Terriglobales bacterium]|nr:hypothetical protein [Terriglobales bacterium]
MPRIMSRALFGMMAVVPIAGAMLYLQMRAATPGGKAGSAPKAIMDTTAVKNELLALANAERQEFALEGKFNSDIDDLMKKSEFKLAPTDKAPYKYSAEVTPTGFRVIATYSGPPNSGAPKTISIDETMEIKTE